MPKGNQNGPQNDPKSSRDDPQQAEANTTMTTTTTTTTMTMTTITDDYDSDDYDGNRLRVPDVRPAKQEEQY